MRSGKDHLRKAAEGGAGGAPPAAARKGEVAPARAARRACRPFAKEKAAALRGGGFVCMACKKTKCRAAAGEPCDFFLPVFACLFRTGPKQCLSCHPEPCEGSLLKYCQDLNRDPSIARRLCRRSTQDDKEVAKPPFNNLTARAKIAILAKRTQFAENFRLNEER